MVQHFAGCLCCVRVTDNGEDGTVKIFAESDSILQPIIDYIRLIYNRYDEVRITDVLVGSWATGYRDAEEVYAEYVLTKNPDEHMLMRLKPENEQYARYVLVISGFVKES